MGLFKAIPFSCCVTCCCQRLIFNNKSLLSLADDALVGQFTGLCHQLALAHIGYFKVEEVVFGSLLTDALRR